jgi:hypothetical protein
MDAAPRSYAELPRDPELAVTVPFACGTDDGYGGRAPSVRALAAPRVTQCALSRVCGVCGAGLGRPIAFLGSRAEADRNAFHFPPAHLSCVETLLAEVRDLPVGVLGHDEPPAAWTIVTTAGFEFVRPNREDLDRRPTFQPNAVLSESGR